jgi:hypothetical protein
MDTRKLDKKGQSDLNVIADSLVRRDKPEGAGKAIEDTRKSLVAVNQLGQALKTTEEISTSGKNINLVDKAIRDNFSQYFGMSDEEMQTAFRDKRYASASNVIRNSLFGAAVSKQEGKNFIDATASLYGTNKNLVLGMKSMMEDVKAKIEINADVIGQAAFNLKFGGRLRNIEDLISSIDNVIAGKTEDKGKKLAELRKKDTGSRDAMYNQIKTQRPNATPEQINAYLTSKGY